MKLYIIHETSGGFAREAGLEHHALYKAGAGE